MCVTIAVSVQYVRRCATVCLLECVPSNDTVTEPTLRSLGGLCIHTTTATVLQTYYLAPSIASFFPMPASHRMLPQTNKYFSQESYLEVKCSVEHETLHALSSG